jgi:transposase-like protein
MNRKECPACGSKITDKNGIRNGIQLYVCKACGHQFREGTKIDDDEIWCRYMSNKQTIEELARRYDISPSTVKRRLRKIKKTWKQPPLSGGGFVHLDATYWGRNSGVMLALDETSGMPLYVNFISHEKVQDYKDAVAGIEARGYVVRGIILDGMQSLFKEFKAYHIQMCQFHMRSIIKRYLTKNPKLRAARDLKALMGNLTNMKKSEFEDAFNNWKHTWHDTLYKRSMLKSGKTQYTHRRLRSAMHSIEFYLPYLFTYQLPECTGMPNTNNKIEGTFTDLKKNLNNHSGMSDINRRRFISGFFLALKERLNERKQETAE